MLVRSNLRSLVAMALTTLAVGVFATTAFAGKWSYSPTLTVSFPASASTLTASSDVNYTITGCGYNSSYGVVTVVVYSPVSAGWTGADPNASGCISVSNFSTQGAGSYRVQAWQQVGKKTVEVASTSFTRS